MFLACIEQYWTTYKSGNLWAFLKSSNYPYQTLNIDKCPSLNKFFIWPRHKILTPKHLSSSGYWKILPNDSASSCNKRGNLIKFKYHLIGFSPHSHSPGIGNPLKRSKDMLWGTSTCVSFNSRLRSSNEVTKHNNYAVQTFDTSPGDLRAVKCNRGNLLAHWSCGWVVSFFILDNKGLYIFIAHHDSIYSPTIIISVWQYGHGSATTRLYWQPPRLGIDEGRTDGGPRQQE